MKQSKNRILDFPGKVEEYFLTSVVCKRHVYLDAYLLLTPAYFLAYPAAYLPFTGRAESRLKTSARLITWLEKSARHRAVCGLFQVS